MSDTACRASKVGPTGIEWVCVKEVHAKIYTRRSGDRTHPRGGLIYSNNPQVDMHYYVNRWPRRSEENK